MKRKIVVAVLLVCCFAFAACGKEPEPEKGKVSTESEGKTKIDDAAETETEGDDAEQPALEGEQITTELFTLTYPEGWVYEEDDIVSSESRSKVYMNLPTKDDPDTSIYLFAEVTMNSADSFTRNLVDEGIDPYEAIAEGKGEKVTLGDREYFVTSDGYTKCFFNCDEDASAFTMLKIGGIKDETADLVPQAEEIFKNLAFTYKPYEGETIPWYWDGAPYAVEPHTTTVGSYTIESNLIPFEEPIVSFDTFNSRMGIINSDFYIYNGEEMQLAKYSIDGDKLKFDSEVPFSIGEIKEISASTNGDLYICNASSGLKKITDGTESDVMGDTDYVAVSPNGEWGIDYFVKNEVQKLDLVNGTKESKTLEGVSGVTHVFCTNDNALISGSRAEDNKAFLLIVDKDLNEVARLTSDDTTTGYYGSVSAITQTENGYFVVDGNMRDIYLLDNDFGFIGVMDMKDAIGTNYPWPCAAVTAPDGNIYLLCTDGRADQSAHELVVFRVSGF